MGEEERLAVGGEARQSLRRTAPDIPCPFGGRVQNKTDGRSRQGDYA